MSLSRGELEKVELNGSTRVRMSEVDRWLDEEVDPEELVQMADKVEEDVSVIRSRRCWRWRKKK